MGHKVGAQLTSHNVVNGFGQLYFNLIYSNHLTKIEIRKQYR